MYAGIPHDETTSPFNFVVSEIEAGQRPVNRYVNLKNLQWDVNVDFDRNAEYFPLRGARYVSFYFKLQREEVPVGGFDLPSEEPQISETEFVLYINESLEDLITQFDMWTADMNA
jgi:hypothetical protein